MPNLVGAVPHAVVVNTYGDERLPLVRDAVAAAPHRRLAPRPPDRRRHQRQRAEAPRVRPAQQEMTFCSPASAAVTYVLWPSSRARRTRPSDAYPRFAGAFAERGVVDALAHVGERHQPLA